MWRTVDASNTFYKAWCVQNKCLKLTSDITRSTVPFEQFKWMVYQYLDFVLYQAIVTDGTGVKIYQKIWNFSLKFISKAINSSREMASKSYHILLQSTKYIFFYSCFFYLMSCNHHGYISCVLPQIKRCRTFLSLSLQQKPNVKKATKPLDKSELSLQEPPPLPHPKTSYLFLNCIVN